MSKLEFYRNAIRLRKSLTFLLLRDIGVKNKVRNLQIVTKPMDEADKKAFMDIAIKYGYAGFLSEYPDWIVAKLRDSIWDDAHSMMRNITSAYTVWATNLSEAYERRNHINQAIADCECLLKDLEEAIDILPVDADKYMHYVDMIEKEIALLKGWRKTDNKRIREMKGS